MRNKKFIKLFFLIPLLLIVLILSINFIVDPYNLTNYNALKIKHKMARDARMEKIAMIKKERKISNLILGSSRSQKLNPAYMTEKYGGFSYNFGVGGATIEDSLGVLLYMEKKNKLPKNIVLALDFGSFNSSVPIAESFYKIPELNFLDNKSSSFDDMYSKMFSIDAIRATFKTLKYHIKKKIPSTYFDENGYLQSTEKENYSDKHKLKKKIVKIAKLYYEVAYGAGEYELSKERLNYLKQVIALCKENNINLIVSLYPVHIYQYNLIKKNEKLNKTWNNFKEKLVKITPYRDFMIKSDFTSNDKYFRDSVHFLKEYADIYMKDILNTNTSDLFIYKK